MEVILHKETARISDSPSRRSLGFHQRAALTRIRSRKSSIHHIKDVHAVNKDWLEKVSLKIILINDSSYIKIG